MKALAGSECQESNEEDISKTNLKLSKSPGPEFILLLRVLFPRPIVCKHNLHFTQLLMLPSSNISQHRQRLQSTGYICMNTAMPTSIISPRSNIPLAIEKSNIMASISSQIDRLATRRRRRREQVDMSRQMAWRVHNEKTPVAEEINRVRE